MPVEEHTIGWYAPDSPVRLEVITDHTGWREIEPYGVGHLPGCLQGTISSEPGYVRAWNLFGNAPDFGKPSNIMALPEASPIGLVLGLLLLIGFGRKRSAG